MESGVPAMPPPREIRHGRILGERERVEPDQALSLPPPAQTRPGRLSLSAVAPIRMGTSATHRSQRSTTAGRPKPPRGVITLIRVDDVAAFVVGGLPDPPRRRGIRAAPPPRQSCRSVSASLRCQEPQRLGQPAGAGQQPLGLLGHVALLQMVDELRGLLALGLAHGFENARLGDAAEIVVDGRRQPASTMSSPTARASRSAWSRRVRGHARDAGPP
jgi:hypothetical protein